MPPSFGIIAMAHEAGSIGSLAISVLESSEIENPLFSERLVSHGSLRMKLVHLRLLLVGYVHELHRRRLILIPRVVVHALLGYVCK